MAPAESTTYPNWVYYPQNSRPPEWVHTLVDAVSRNQRPLSGKGQVTSDKALAILHDDLELLGYEVEVGRSTRLRRPVLFGPQGSPRVTYDVDAYHPELGVLLEIEAGRAWQGNAVYRDLVRTSLILDANYLALGVLNEYVYGSRRTTNKDFEETRNLLDAVFASGRLALPFEGILLFGY